MFASLSWLSVWLWPAAVLTVAVFGLSLTLAIYLRRRRFQRTNRMGVEEYSTFGRSLASGAYEGLLRLVLALLLACFFASAMTTVVAFMAGRGY